MRGSLLFQRRTLRQLVISSTFWSKQNKLIIFFSFCCVALTLVFLLASSSSLQSQHQLNLLSAAPNRRTRKGYTLLINTWKRYDLLKRSISHYASCPMLDSIHIIWSEPDPPSKSLVEFLNYVVQSSSKDDHQVELKFDINKEDSLNNRFKERDLKTDAVFSIDDDVIFPCSSVDFAFSVWLSAQDTMVGFVPRMHGLSELHDNPKRYTYGGWWSVWWTGTYSMVLSKAAFFHKKYLKMYTNEMPSSIREFVTKNRNCEDIAMSFLIANASGAPPIWVKGKIFEIGSTGISSMGGHTEKRSYCVNRFAAEYGQMPLISTSVKAVDSRNIWFW